jgi:MFS family permease
VSERLFTPRFLALWLFAFLTFFSAFQLLPAIPFRILELGGSTAAAGSFLAVYTFASALAAPLMGTIADHVGRKRMLFLASLLFIGFSLAYGYVTWLPALLLIGVVHGTIWSALMSSSSALMSEIIPPSRRAEGLGYWGLASTGAVAIAPAAGFLIFHRFGWTTLCLELAALSVLMTLWATRLPDAGAYGGAERPVLRDVWDWKVLKIAGSLAVTAFGYGGITSYAAILSIQRHIDPPSLYLTVFAVTVVVVRLFTSHLADKVGTRTVLYPAFVALPISFATLALAQQRWQLIASAILFGLGLGAAFPAFMSFLIANTDPRRRARTFGSFVGAFDTGIGTGSIVIGVIGGRWGLGTAFAIAAGLSWLAIPIFNLATRGLDGTAVAAEVGHAGT